MIYLCSLSSRFATVFFFQKQKKKTEITVPLTYNTKKALNFLLLLILTH